MSQSKPVYLMVTAYFPNPGNRWTCSFVYDMAKAIEKHSDYKVVVFNPNYTEDYNFNGIDVYSFIQRTRGNWLSPKIAEWINVKKLGSTLKKSGIRLESIKVVHGHGISSAPYLKAFSKWVPNAKRLMHHHDCDPTGMLMGNTRFKARKYFLYYRSLFKYVDSFVSISNCVSDMLRESPQVSRYESYGPMVTAKTFLSDLPRMADMAPIYLLHNGVDRSIFRSLPDIRPEAKRFTIGCLGIFRTLKDHITLLKAAKILKPKIPNIKIRLIGYGPTLAECREYVKLNCLDVEFIHSVEHNDLPRFYNEIDLFVLPSYFEGFGCVFTESWACGTPFITCEGQGIEDVIPLEERHLWLCKERNPIDLADKIAYYYENRPKQTLVGPITFDELIPPFLEYVKGLKK